MSMITNVIVNKTKHCKTLDLKDCDCMSGNWYDCFISLIKCIKFTKMNIIT